MVNDQKYYLLVPAVALDMRCDNLQRKLSITVHIRESCWTCYIGEETER